MLFATYCCRTSKTELRQTGYSSGHTHTCARTRACETYLSHSASNNERSSLALVPCGVCMIPYARRKINRQFAGPAVSLAAGFSVSLPTCPPARRALWRYISLATQRPSFEGKTRPRGFSRANIWQQHDLHPLQGGKWHGTSVPPPPKNKDFTTPPQVINSLGVLFRTRMGGNDIQTMSMPSLSPREISPFSRCC